MLRFTVRASRPAARRVARAWPVAVLAVSLAFVTTASAAPPAGRAAPCDRPECRQFDFWIGDWDVYTRDGKPSGSSRIESILDGCVVLENWKGAQGPDGKSFNLWTRNDSLWHQTWVSGVGGMLSLAGSFHDGAMVLEGGASSRQPAGTRNRITWTPGADGTVSQKWELSTDGGKTWSESFLGIYKRKPGSN